MTTDHPFSVPAEVTDHLLTVLAEGRAIQGAWNRDPPGGRGKAMMCFMGAMGGPDKPLSSSSECPADRAPAWLAELIPTLNDGVSPEFFPTFWRGAAERTAGFGRITAEGWERIRVGFLCATVEQALAAAESVCPTPRPSWFDQVHDACGRVLKALRGDGDIAAAEAAAWATEAAAPATLAARAAAWAACAAAARAAAWAARAAEAAAWAARAAAWAARAAARAAEAAAYQRLVTTLFDLIDAELAP